MGKKYVDVIFFYPLTPTHDAPPRQVANGRYTKNTDKDC